MQQVNRYEESINNVRPYPEKGPSKKPRKKSATIKCPPDAYIQRITCPTRQQFYKNLLQQERASAEKKFHIASRCSSKLNYELRFKKVAAEDHGDDPFRDADEDGKGHRSGNKKGRKARLRRLRHRKELCRYKSERFPTVEDRQIQANIEERCEAHYCKVANKNSALYNTTEGLSDHLKYGVFTRKGRPSVRSADQPPGRASRDWTPRRDRRPLYPQGQLRNFSRRPSDSGVPTKQVLKLSSSQIMHLDIKPKGVLARRLPFSALPFRKVNNIKNSPHFILYGRSSPMRQHYSNISKRQSQCRRNLNTPVRGFMPSRSWARNRGKGGNAALLKPPSKVSSRNKILQLYRMVSPNPKMRLTHYPPNIIRYIPNIKNLRAPKAQTDSGAKYMHQPRGDKRSAPMQNENSNLRSRSTSLQHAPSVHPTTDCRHHSIPRQPQRMISTYSTEDESVRGNTLMRTQRPTLISNKPSVLSRRATSLFDRLSSLTRGTTFASSCPLESSRAANLRDKPSLVSRGVNSLRERPTPSISRGVSSLRNGPPLLSGATSLRERASMSSSAANSLRDKPFTREQTRPIPQRPESLRKISGFNSLRVRPPVPSRAQTSINAEPLITTSKKKRTSMRDLLDNLQDSTQRNLKQQLECPRGLNNAFNKNQLLPSISLRPLRKCPTLSSYCSCDVLPENDEEETMNFDKTGSSHTTYTISPEYCKLTSQSTQTLICQSESMVYNTNKRA